MSPNSILPLLLGLAWLLPLASFALLVLVGPRLGKHGRLSAHVATTAIGAGFVLSLVALVVWLAQPAQPAAQHEAHVVHAPTSANHTTDAHHAPAAPARPAISGDWYTLARFGALELTIGYYIDALTVTMFCMVTLIATCIHVYSSGYMHEELHDVTDPLVQVQGKPLVRAGRYARFFQYLSLFCFSMLGLVVAGNIAMVFVFWELVGICSYFLIGFYRERQSASNAANKAFIVNRVGDFGMIVGLMVIWTTLGTFSFADVKDAEGHVVRPGIFSQVRPAEGGHALIVPDGMVKAAAQDEVAKIVRATPGHLRAVAAVEAEVPRWREMGYGYGLLMLAGLGIFCGCIGKSAQFPLHVWLPDAMEGPTPVSALIHAATMVAAGVYLVGRFYPAFAPEVLLVIAYVGCVTLFIAATIAITATDIKRVLAYSTVSQLGYMMLALGVGGWVAGLFHLLTHAFFKALLFLCSGSVIHACHTNEMPQMGGLWRKMPWTAWTMLAGCLAIAGAGVPLLIGLSGYHSKDAMIAQMLSFAEHNPLHGWLFYAATAGAGVTAFYMFRLWFLTFAGQPRDKHVYEHAHESPLSMYGPLVVLAVLAVIAGKIGLTAMLEQARPAGISEGIAAGRELPSLVIPAEHLSHDNSIHVPATLAAFGVALVGFLLATAFYWTRRLDPEDARRQFAPIYGFLWHKWWFDELYQWLFVRPTLWLADFAAAIDRQGIDWLADNTARAAKAVSTFDDWIDRLLVDGLVNSTARWTYGLGLRLRAMQTGSLRQYVMYIVVGTVGLFVLIVYWNLAIAGM